MRNEKGEVTTDRAEIQRIVRDYYEQLYDNKMDNREEMDRFLEKFNLPRLNQEEIEIMNNPNTRRLHNTFLNNQQDTGELKREIKKCLETKDNENTTTQNLWDEVVLRGMFIARQSYLKKEEKHRIDNLNLQLKQLEK